MEFFNFSRQLPITPAVWVKILSHPALAWRNSVPNPLLSVTVRAIAICTILSLHSGWPSSKSTNNGRCQYKEHWRRIRPVRSAGMCFCDFFSTLNMITNAPNFPDVLCVVVAMIHLSHVSSESIPRPVNWDAAMSRWCQLHSNTSPHINAGQTPTITDELDKTGQAATTVVVIPEPIPQLLRY